MQVQHVVRGCIFYIDVYLTYLHPLLLCSVFVPLATHPAICTHTLYTHTLHCTIYTVYCTLYNIHTHCTVQYTLYTANCTLYNIQIPSLGYFRHPAPISPGRHVRLPDASERRLNPFTRPLQHRGVAQYVPLRPLLCVGAHQLRLLQAYGHHGQLQLLPEHLSRLRAGHADGIRPAGQYVPDLVYHCLSGETATEIKMETEIKTETARYSFTPYTCCVALRVFIIFLGGKFDTHPIHSRTRAVLLAYLYTIMYMHAFVPSLHDMRVTC